MTVLTVTLINPFSSAGDQTQVLTNVKGQFTPELHALFISLLKPCSVHGRKILNICPLCLDLCSSGIPSVFHRACGSGGVRARLALHNTGYTPGNILHLIFTNDSISGFDYFDNIILDLRQFY